MLAGAQHVGPIMPYEFEVEFDLRIQVQISLPVPLKFGRLVIVGYGPIFENLLRSAWATLTKPFQTAIFIRALCSKSGTIVQEGYNCRRAACLTFTC